MTLAPGVKEIRCTACQLQLCKSRDEQPHSNLSEVTRDDIPDGQSASYLCQTCGVRLVRSADMARAGWSIQRVTA